MAKSCSVNGCTDKYHAKGFCRNHYGRWKKYGNPLHVPDPEETFKKKSKTRKGIPASPEQKRKQHDAMKDKIPWSKGVKFSQKHKDNLSKATMGRPSPRKGVPHTKEANEKNRLAHLGKKATPETKNKMSTSQHKPETLVKNRERRYLQGGTTESKNERLVQTYLKENNIYFEKHFKFKFNNRIVCIPDLLIAPNKIIEVYGDRYHANPASYAPDDVIKGIRNGSVRAGDIQEKDARNNKLMQKQGYEILILWEYEFASRQKPKITPKVIEKISEFLRNYN